MGFRRRTTAELTELRQELDLLRSRLADEHASRQTLEHLVIALDRRDATEPIEVHDLPPPEPGTSLAELRDDLATLVRRVAELDDRGASDHELVRLRLDELATHLNNQLGELANELDDGHVRLRDELAAQATRLDELASADASPGAGPDMTERLEELRANQVRLANDLARHEIAVHHDLAALAELLGRARATR